MEWKNWIVYCQAAEQILSKIFESIFDSQNGSREVKINALSGLDHVSISSNLDLVLQVDWLYSVRNILHVR